jgi:hypothetical protein
MSGSRSRCTPSRDTSAPLRFAALGDLVDLVDEHDAVLLDGVQGAGLDLLLVDQLRRLLVAQEPRGLLDRQLAALRLAAPRLENMLCSWLVISSMPGGAHDLDAELLLLTDSSSISVVELAFAQLLAEASAACLSPCGCRCREAALRAGGGSSSVEDALLGGVFGAVRTFSMACSRSIFTAIRRDRGRWTPRRGRRSRLP